jgi:transcriptional regulator of heat shock response
MIGVLGPRRMPYSRLTAIVDYTAGMVGRILTRLAQ